MDKQEKIKIAVTAGIGAVILLILVLVLALSGKKDSTDDQKLSESITQYADVSSSASSVEEPITASEQASSEASKEEISEEVTEAASEASSNEETAKESKDKDKDKDSKMKKPASETGFFVTEKATLKDVYKGMKINVETQLKELYAYWSDGNTAAVRDLAHLQRFEVMSVQLSGTNDFYYYGDMNGSGQPNGMGVAVYGDDQYYYGSWADGKRSGNGTWFCFYPDYSDNVVIEHMYSGEWALDLPDGKGQDHYDYDVKLMNDVDYYLQNAIGGFSKGMYDGEMYVITLDKDENAIEWKGTCKNGTWQQVLYSTVDKNGQAPFLSQIHDTDRHIYMSEKGSQNSGVRGIIYGGSVKGY